VIQAPAAQVLTNEPINGTYSVGPDGRIDLGYSYGKVPVGGLTADEAREAIKRHVADTQKIKAPALSLVLRRPPGLPPIHGEHAVHMDGTVSLGVYGDVYVAGLTPAQAKQAVEEQLAKRLVRPEVAVDVLGCNSKVYYVIFDCGAGQHVVMLPFVVGETVLDAVSKAQRGLPPPPAGSRVWVARPVPGIVCCRQVLPVDWEAITAGGATTTNYQLFPGDRVYVKSDCWAACRRCLSRVGAACLRLLDE
jgi:protein involved in polysaccharide export with SLBB domain